MKQGFGKIEKLKSKATLDKLFAEGQKVKSFPVILIYYAIEACQHKAGVSAPKRNFKKAVDRNKLKRLMREGYRLNKDIVEPLTTKYALMFIYTGKEKSTYQEISKSIKNCLQQLRKKHHKL